MYSLLLLLFQLFSLSNAWKKYADTIQLAKPDEKGHYVFDLVVEKKLTMSYTEGTFGHRFPVDYDPITKMWSFRDPDQLKDCFLSHSMRYDNNTKGNFEDILLLDGKHYRVVTINGQTPGPVLAVPFGAEVILRVHNNLMLDSFTIHVHGIDKQGLWFEDGVAFIQQCPITTATIYEYRFLVDRAGTHWYHGHLQTDRGDGLLGGFVVYKEDRSVPLEKGGRKIPDRDYFMMLQDWDAEDTDKSWMSLKEKTMKWMYGMDGHTKCWQPTRMHDGGNVGGATPFSAILINSKGWHSQSDILRRTDSLPLETYRIKKGENILIRIVNGGLAQELMIHIEGHPIVVVAADGNEVKPMKVDKLVIFPGERYDILITGKEKADKKRYHIIVETVQYYFFDWTKVETMYGVANLEYEDVAEKTVQAVNVHHPDCSLEKKCSVLNCPFENYPPGFPFECVSYSELVNAYEIDDKEILQDTPFDKGFEEHFINMHYDSHVNGYKFMYPSGMPYFYHDRMDEIVKDCDKVNCPRNHSKFDENCRCFYHITHKLGNIVQLTLYNMGTGGGLATGYAHPFHLHSSHFYVMKMGWPKYNASGFISEMNKDLPCKDDKAICNDLKWTNSQWLNGSVQGMNTKNPTLRDAVLIPVGGYVVLRFRANNPGWWFAHCHLELHAMGGSAYAFRIGEHNEIPPPPPGFHKDCGVYKRQELPRQAHERMRKTMAEEKKRKRTDETDFKN